MIYRVWGSQLQYLTFIVMNNVKLGFVKKKKRKKKRRFIILFIIFFELKLFKIKGLISFFSKKKEKEKEIKNMNFLNV